MQNKDLLRYTKGLTMIVGGVNSGKTVFQQILLELLIDSKDVVFFHQESTINNILSKVTKVPGIGHTTTFHETRELGKISEIILKNNTSSVIFVECIDCITTKKGGTVLEKHDIIINKFKELNNLGYNIIMTKQVRRDSVDDVVDIDTREASSFLKTMGVLDNLVSVNINRSVKLDYKFIKCVKKFFRLKLKHNFDIRVLKARYEQTRDIEGILTITDDTIKLKLL